MPGQVLLLNPKRRHHKRRHKASPAQRAARERFAAMARARSSNPRRRRRVRRNPIATLAANPRRHRRMRSNPRRRYRDHASKFARGILPKLTGAAVMGAGAALVDYVNGRFLVPMLPAASQSRYDANGAVNWTYYGAKTALALALGWAGAKYGGRFSTRIAEAAQGSLAVQAYEIIRANLPAEIVAMGYAPNRSLSAYSARPKPVPANVRPLRAYSRLGGFAAGSSYGGNVPAGEYRVGEGAVT